VATGVEHCCLPYNQGQVTNWYYNDGRLLCVGLIKLCFQNY